MKNKANQYLLGIDNGGTMSKAALFDADGTELACASHRVDIIELHPGWNERDAGVMWEQTAAAIREVIQTSEVNPVDIAGIACTGHGNGLYLVDEKGAPVRNAINSTDSRAASYVDDCIRMTGGAARSEVWVQMFADCFQIPVEIPAGTELGALGAAIAAAVATGVYPDYAQAVKAMTGVARRHEPNPANAEIYATKYKRYKKCVEALDAIWR